MSYEADIATKLLSGKVICTHAYHEDYQRLTQDSLIQDKVSEILLSLERQLVQSDSGNAFYAVHAKLTSDTKREAKEFFQYLVSNARYYLGVLDFFAEACDQDVFIQAGEKIHYSDIARALTHNNALQEKLRHLLGTRAEKDVSKMAEKLIKDLLKDELIIVVNTQRLEYRFTGKLELVQQGLTYISEQNRLGIDTTEYSEGNQKGIRL
ncbi:MAG: hypothetical protein C9356_12110 [Oleiphilus sp.]|nr:MAG: hypothetical protein C9356_12110 [Oleiphilus sp.]